MTHSEQRAHWAREFAIGQATGVLYGITSIAVGHPFDTLKTKMQGQAGFERTSMVGTLLKTLRSQGVVGLYRYTMMGNTFFTNEIPGTAGLQLRVLCAGAVASTARAVIETPLEYAKVRRQTQQSWQFRHLYTGFGVTWTRTMGLMCSYFVLVDTLRRNYNDLFSRPLVGPFLVSGMSATLAWWIVWPLEYMKSQVQCNYGGKPMPVLKRMQLVVRERGGFLGLYRGLGPGTIRSFVSNGCSMVVMNWAQRKVSEWGLRK